MSYPNLAKHTWGKVGRPHIIALHGWGASSQVWAEFLQHLSEDFFITALDLPGHGNSPAVTGCDNWLPTIKNALPNKPFYLMGWSLGGYLAQALLPQLPQAQGFIGLFTSLAFVNEKQGIAPETFANFEKCLAENPDKLLAQFQALQVKKAPDERRAWQRLKKAGLLTRADLPSLQQGLECLNKLQFNQAWSPSLWFFGQKDILVPPSAAEKIHAQKWMLPCGHLGFLTHRDTLTEKIKAFVHE